MRAITSMQASWRADTRSGETLFFETCKGGYFSDSDEYGLKVIGRTSQEAIPTTSQPQEIKCVKQGTKIRVEGENLVPYPYKGGNYSANEEKIVFEMLSDGTLLINGTGSNSTYYTFSERIYFPPGRYTLWNAAEIGTKEAFGLRGSGNSDFFWLKNGEEIKQCDLVGGVYYFQYQSGTIEHRHGSVRPAFVKGDEVREYKLYQKSGELTTPCDLYEGDIWYPATGKVVRRSIYKLLENKANGVYRNKNGFVRFDIRPSNSVANGKVWCDCIPNTFQLRGKWTSAFLDDVSVIFFHSSANILYISLPYEELGEAINEQTSNNDLISAYKAWVNNRQVFLSYELAQPVTEEYSPQAIFAASGAVNIIQTPVENKADLQATMLIRR